MSDAYDPDCLHCTIARLIEERDDDLFGILGNIFQVLVEVIASEDDPDIREQHMAMVEHKLRSEVAATAVGFRRMRQ